MPAVAQIIRDGGLDIAPGVTFLVGENGSGKSTLVEAFAAIYPRAGHRPGANAANVTGAEPSEEDSPLAFHLRPQTHRLASPAGFFLRAESMHEILAAEDRNAPARAWGGEKLQHRSHGESFLAVLKFRFEDVGVYFLDEPESALSFQSCLSLVALLDVMRREGSQVIVATHSPLLASLPDATLLQVDDAGITHVPRYDDLELVKSWRQYLAAPERYLRHLLDDPAQ